MPTSSDPRRPHLLSGLDLDDEFDEEEEHKFAKGLRNEPCLSSAAAPDAEYVGEEGKTSFYARLHSDMDRKLHVPPASPRSQFMAECQRLSLVPESSCVVRKSREPEFDLRCA